MRAEAPHVRRTPNKRVQVPMHGMGIVAPMAIYPQDDSIPKMTNFGMSLTQTNYGKGTYMPNVKIHKQGKPNKGQDNHHMIWIKNVREKRTTDGL